MDLSENRVQLNPVVHHHVIVITITIIIIIILITISLPTQPVKSDMLYGYVGHFIPNLNEDIWRPSKSVQEPSDIGPAARSGRRAAAVGTPGAWGLGESDVFSGRAYVYPILCVYLYIWKETYVYKYIHTCIYTYVSTHHTSYRHETKNISKRNYIQWSLVTHHDA